jgi:predicted solute-binding protein
VTSPLHDLRVGCVQYLNAKPLIYGYDGDVTFDHPAVLARELALGRLDAALVPVFEVLRDPHYAIVDGCAVACEGPVHSVVLAYRGKLQDIHSVTLDPASMSSVHLLKVLLAEFHRMHPEYCDGGEARLLIGNQAIEFRATAHDQPWQFLDLGEEWRRQTGLPFVFAVWALRPAVRNMNAVADAFRAVKAHGLANLGAIVSAERVQDAAFRQRYLGGHIRYDMGAREKLGLALYRELLAKWLLIESAEPPLRFV